jgi:glycosyltransferase involved in cell wall biosynthesis
MKILHLIDSVDPRRGGPIEGIVRHDQIARPIAHREIASLDPPDAAYLKDFPLAVHALGETKPPIPLRPLVHYRFSRKLIPWLKANVDNYDAVIVNGLWNYTACAASIVLPRKRTPYFVFTHGMLDPWFRAAYPVKHLGKQLSWWLAEGRLLSRSRAVLFTSEEEMTSARGVFLGHGYSGEVVPYGALRPPRDETAQRAAFKAAVPQLNGRDFLLYLGRIHRKKGVDLLVEAFAKLATAFPDIDLVVAGPDQDGSGAQLQARAAALGLDDRIHWPGMLQGAPKWGAFRAAQAFVLPSHQENFGIVVAEALACGAPVLLTDKVNIWREVVNGGAGLAAPDDQEGVRRLLFQWLSKSRAEKAAVARSASALFDRQFDLETGAPQLIARLKTLSGKLRPT